MRYLNYHSAAKNKLLCVLSIPTMILSGSGSVGAADDLWQAAHGKFISAFNQRDWSAVAAMMSDDSVFHRATGNEVFIGPKAIVERFSSTIGAEDQWNVKFAKLDTTESLTGKDGRVVERGDFVSQVLDQGQIQSSENVEIRCEARARNGNTTVLNVVPEASLVQPGDFLIQLDSTAFEKELEEQRITLVNSQAAVISHLCGLIELLGSLTLQ